MACRLQSSVEREQVSPASFYRWKQNLKVGTSQAIHEDPDDKDSAKGFSDKAAFDDGGLSILSASRGPVAWRDMD